MLDMHHDGRTEKLIKDIIDKSKNMGFQADGGGTASFLQFFKLGASAHAGASRDSNNVVTKNITNTILTDFIDLIAKGKFSSLKEIKDYKLFIENNSAAFLKSISPFIKLLNSTITNPGEIELDPQKFDDVLLEAKGYYELLGTYHGDNSEKDTQLICRFNLDGLRNNYKLQDLQRMNMILYGIEVGTASATDLSFENDFSMDSPDAHDKTNPLPVSTDQINEEHESDHQSNPNNNEIKIYDIIIAGIKNE